jgi:hypothetical protein
LLFKFHENLADSTRINANTLEKMFNEDDDAAAFVAKPQLAINWGCAHS